MPTTPAPETDWYVETTIRSMADRVLERRERGDEHHGRAVRTGRDALGQLAQVLRVHLGDDERDVGVHPERGRVVDDLGARRGGDRRPLERDRVVDVDDHEVEAVEASGARGPRRSPRPRRTGACGPRTATTRRPGAGRRGNARSSRMRSISWPTRPVAPMTPTFMLITAGRFVTSARFGPHPDRALIRPCPARTRSAAPRTAALDVGLLDHARDPDRRRADHLDVDALVARAPRTSWRRHPDSSSCPRRRA